MEELIEQPVQLRVHDPAWAERFRAERSALALALGSWASGGIHHIGSTAIAGVDAEPVIDILVGTGGAEAAGACCGPLVELGYAALPQTSSTVHSFCKPEPQRRAYELHLVPTESARFSEMMSFRDLLRADLQVAIGYAAMKRNLARSLGADRRRYTAAKADLIRTVLTRI